MRNMNCKICDKETNVTFEIKRVDYPICPSCSTSIFLHQAKAYAQNQTIFDISNKKERVPIKKHPEIACDVLNYLYGTLLKTGETFTPENVPKGYTALISARVNQGHTAEELKAVAYIKYKEWSKDKEMCAYIKPDTLYRPRNFSRYLSEVEVLKPNWNVVSTKKQRAIIKELNSFGVRGECNDETDSLAKKLMATGYNRKEFLNLYLKKKI